jgi:hypothetical protein
MTIVTHPTPNGTPATAAQYWREAVMVAASNARTALPECSTRIDRAIELGRVDELFYYQA